jgi:hypothetical protein
MSTPTNKPPPAPTQSSPYKEVSRLVDLEGGVVAILTANESNGRVSFKLMRQFEEKGVTKDTAFMLRRHIPAIRRVLDDLENQLEIEEDRTRTAKRYPELQK